MEEYLAALEHRDAREQANASIIDQYSKLADRLANQANEGRTADTAATPSTITRVGDNNAPDDQALRISLAVAQQARLALETELASFGAMKQENLTYVQLISDQTKEIAWLQRKLNDRNAEIREGKKLISQVQEEMADQMVTMNLQLNIAEQKTADLKNENAQLVDRWMKKMKSEADAMNSLNEKGKR